MPTRWWRATGELCGPTSSVRPPHAPIRFGAARALAPRDGCADAGRLTLDEPSTRALAAAGGQKPDGVHLVLEGEDGQLYGEADYSWGPEAAQPAGWWWVPLVSASGFTSQGAAPSIHDSPVACGGVRQAGGG